MPKDDDQDVQGREPAMGQHLVDDDLEEHRRDQTEELQKRGRDENFREQALVFEDRRHEPGNVELRFPPQDTGAAGREEQAAAPAHLEIGPG